MDAEGARIEHLKLIQGVIDRMARSSFTVKAGATTIVAAAVAVALNSSYLVAVLGGVPLVSVLWTLDAFFLRQERAYRNLFNAVRTGPPAEIGSDRYFSMAAEAEQGQGLTTIGTMSARTLALFYPALVAFLALVSVAAVFG